MLFSFTHGEKIATINEHIGLLRLRHDIDELFARGKRLRYDGKIGVRYIVLENSSDAHPLLFLLVTPKRYIRKAHERNKLKRWLREVVRNSESMEKLAMQLQNANRQMIVSLFIREKPSARMNWDVIRREVEDIAQQLSFFG
ncbi:MAG TPA: ribonuclease P protein component [Candidatus Kapabacteria bacterium]|nr:ribonuclease P protein component [Candidatus Kapabacteria bacterium]